MFSRGDNNSARVGPHEKPAVCARQMRRRAEEGGGVCLPRTYTCLELPMHKTKRSKQRARARVDLGYMCCDGDVINDVCLIFLLFIYNWIVKIEKLFFFVILQV